jgi:ribonuclease HI
MHYVIHTDGGARGNPGPAAFGVTVECNDKIVTEFGKKIGETTNNVAEYSAVIAALIWIKNNIPLNQEDNAYDFFLDSTLVVNQINGLFKIKDNKLRALLVQVRILEEEIKGALNYHIVRREQNTGADRMVNQALDQN